VKGSFYGYLYSYDITVRASAAAGYRREAKLGLKGYKSETGNNDNLDQAVGCMRW